MPGSLLEKFEHDTLPPQKIWTLSPTQSCQQALQFSLLLVLFHQEQNMLADTNTLQYSPSISFDNMGCPAEQSLRIPYVVIH